MPSSKQARGFETMDRQLRLDDIQGNVIRAYGRYSFPCARYFFLHISDSKAGRQFVSGMPAERESFGRHGVLPFLALSQG